MGSDYVLAQHWQTQPVATEDLLSREGTSWNTFLGMHPRQPWTLSIIRGLGWTYFPRKAFVFATCFQIRRVNRCRISQTSETHIHWCQTHHSLSSGDFFLLTFWWKQKLYSDISHILKLSTATSFTLYSVFSMNQNEHELAESRELL